MNNRPLLLFDDVTMTFIWRHTKRISTSCRLSGQISAVQDTKTEHKYVKTVKINQLLSTVAYIWHILRTMITVTW